MDDLSRSCCRNPDGSLYGRRDAGNFSVRDRYGKHDQTDDHKGEWWDFVAHDARQRLVLSVVPGARSIENAEEVVREVHDRTAGHHLTDRHHNARKSRKTYRFSKDWRMHKAMTDFTRYSDNFCQPVRTLRERADSGPWQKRTPAMAAGLADHVWSLKEWLTLPAVQQLQDTSPG